jgi:F420-dependent oxidoreductase-like protein
VRIGLSGGGATVDRVITQAEEAERDGFATLWYSSGAGGDPLVLVALAGRATTSIELGTAVLPTYPCHPLLLAHRGVAVAGAMGRPGLTLGVGPSHGPVIEGMYGYRYDRPGQHTEEYAQILVAALRGERVDVDGSLLSAHGQVPRPDAPIPVLLSALAPRLLRVAGEVTAGTVTWMANARAVASHVAPRIRAAAGPAEPRIVVGLPVAVHDDVTEAREEAAKQYGFYGALPNYRRILDVGGAPGPADAAVVGDEDAVTAQIAALFEAGATDVWAAPFAVGDARASRARTRALLAGLARS